MNSMDIQHDRAGFYLCWGCLVSSNRYGDKASGLPEGRAFSGWVSIWWKGNGAKVSSKGQTVYPIQQIHRACVTRVSTRNGI